GGVPVEQLAVLDAGDCAWDVDSMDNSYVFLNASLPPPVLVLAEQVDVGTLFGAGEGGGVLQVGDVLEWGLFKYRPPSADAHGPAYASFVLYALDSVSAARSTTNATIVLDVLPANDPPVATPSNSSVLAGDAVLLLRGTDVDDGDGASSALIAVLPFRGDLYQIEEAEGGWAFGERVVPYQQLRNMRVGYRYTGRQSEPDAGGSLGSDLFLFKVVDAQGDVSEGAEFLLEIGASLFAEGDVAEVLEDELGEIIQSLPVHGTLFDAAGEEIGVGWEGGGEVFYLSRENYFNFPDVGGWGDLDSFDFTVVAGDATSVVATEFVRVVNTNDRTTLKVPGGVLRVHRSGMGEAEVVRLEGVAVGDVDLGADRVVVEVVTGSNSMLSLDADVLGLADFSSCRTRKNGRDWKCDGDGDQDSEMRFLAQTGDLEGIFGGMFFSSYREGVVENVTIKIFDGSGEGCRGEVEHEREGSWRGGCF
ncbi:hypothetical protein TeGR_g11212, partial [Tetraparma gracilis]